VAWVEILLGRMLQSSESGAKSTVLKTLLWLDGLTAGALILTAVPWSTKGAAPFWIQVMMGAAFGLSFVATILAYGYFAVRDPSLLRSEHFHLRKLQIEKNLIGDSVHGYEEVTSATSPVAEQMQRPVQSLSRDQ
jgi:hypothetical protein